MWGFCQCITKQRDDCRLTELIFRLCVALSGAMKYSVNLFDPHTEGADVHFTFFGFEYSVQVFLIFRWYVELHMLGRVCPLFVIWWRVCVAMWYFGQIISEFMFIHVKNKRRIHTTIALVAHWFKHWLFKASPLKATAYGTEAHTSQMQAFLPSVLL